MYKVIVYLLLAGFCVTCTNDQSNDDTISDSSINIMAYYVPNNESMPSQLPLNKLTHIIFSFSQVIDGKMQIINEASETMLEELVAQKEKYPHLKVMIACGGWGADGFSDAAYSVESREKFTESAIDLIEKYQLDGMDMDWEYPAIPAANTKARPEDKENFTALMKLLREKLDELDRPQTLTFASAGWKSYYDNIELLEVLKYANFMNVMTYDQVGGGNRFTSHHTALGDRSLLDIIDTPLGAEMNKNNDDLPDDAPKWEPQSVEKIIDYCIERGVNPKQLVVGAAFYGRGWKGVPPNNNGLYQPNTGSISSGTNYAALLENYNESNGFVRYWDPVAKAPFLFNAADGIFISYDDTESVQLKTAYAKNKNLAGIMFWQLSGDSKGEKSLLNAIFEEAKK